MSEQARGGSEARWILQNTGRPRMQIPRAVYHDVLIALDESRQINNGQPSLWAFLLDQLVVAAGEQVLHLGCGTGYYTAVTANSSGQRERSQQSRSMRA